jgi:hypothetical protein
LKLEQGHREGNDELIGLDRWTVVSVEDASGLDGEHGGVSVVNLVFVDDFECSA